MDLRQLNLKLTMEDLKKSVTKDVVIIQATHVIDALTSVINKLITALREFYSLYNHEASRAEDIELLLKDVNKNAPKELKQISKEIESLILLKKKQEKYLESLMETCCPELLKITGPLIGSKLIELAGTLKRLAELPSSTIQVLGAEKALFRHLTKKAKPPKFGVIFSHPEVSSSVEKGKAARKIASKISIAVKKDFFRK